MNDIVNQLLASIRIWDGASWSPVAQLPRSLVSEVPEGPVTVAPPPKKDDDDVR
jgi:hypothetical protein